MFPASNTPRNLHTAALAEAGAATVKQNSIGAMRWGQPPSRCAGKEWSEISGAHRNPQSTVVHPGKVAHT